MLRVETPEQTTVELPLAPFGARLVAAIVDHLVVALVTIVVFLAGLAAAIALGTLGAVNPTLVAGLAVVFLVAFQLVSAGWLACAEALGRGQTWGKRLMGLRVVMASGRGLTAGAAFLRNFARLVDNLPLLWGVPTLTAGGQRLGDMLAGTHVVLAARPADPREQIHWPAASYRALPERAFPLTPEQARRLVPDDLDLIEYLLARLARTPPERRPTFLRVVARRYAARLELPPEDLERIQRDPRRFLLELGLLLRARHGEAA